MLDTAFLQPALSPPRKKKKPLLATPPAPKLIRCPAPALGGNTPSPPSRNSYGQAKRKRTKLNLSYIQYAALLLLSGDGLEGPTTRLHLDGTTTQNAWHLGLQFNLWNEHEVTKRHVQQRIADNVGQASKLQKNILGRPHLRPYFEQLLRVFCARRHLFRAAVHDLVYFTVRSYDELRVELPAWLASYVRKNGRMKSKYKIDAEHETERLLEKHFGKKK